MIILFFFSEDMVYVARGAPAKDNRGEPRRYLDAFNMVTGERIRCKPMQKYDCWFSLSSIKGRLYKADSGTFLFEVYTPERDR